MSTSQSRTRALALLVGLIAFIGASCVPEPVYPPYYGITFNAPGIGYVGKFFTPAATATSGLPVALTLDASSTGCSFVDGVVIFNSVGTCVINANQPGDATHDPSAQVQRKISVRNCPPLRSGIWTGPLGLTANVIATGSVFTGSADLSSLGYGVVGFSGSVSCEVANMTLNGVALVGYLSPDGSTLSSNYNGIDLVLNAPPA